jgi:phosphonate transport system substrate-binding protein
MSQRTGIPVQALVSDKHSELVEAMRQGKAQISMGNKLSLELVESGICKVFAQVVKKNGERGYHSVLITRADSPLNSLPDLLAQRGQYRFMNGDPKSTSGSLVPAFHVFSKNKTSPQQLFKSVSTGNHQKNFDAILKTKRMSRPTAVNLSKRCRPSARWMRKNQSHLEISAVTE